MKSKMPFDVFIFLSSEDDKHLVSGGIGTYLGLMTKYCKKLWPNAEVFWLTKSHTKKDFFEEIDGVKRYYFSDQVFFKNKPFYTNIIHHKFEDMVVYENFISKLSNKVSDILREYSGKNIYIESGEWEGHGKDIFNIINSPNILKNVRLHTPLASCIKQNGLIVSSSTALQLVNEFQTIINADCISACTDFVKSTLVKDVLGKKLANTLNSKIIVRPNPIDKKNFSHSNITRNQAIDFLNSIVGRSFFDETTFNILLIGSVEYRKGTHLMIKSIPRLLRALPNARICFIGHHGDNNHQPTANTKLSPKILCSELKKNEREKVAFTNYIPHKELPNAIMAGDVFPFLSLGDNFPGSVAEVSLMGKPIIALMTGGLAEMLTEDNKCLAYSLGSKTKNLSEKLVDALVELYGNPSRRKTIGRCLKKSMIKRYDAQRVVRETFEAYNNIYHKKKLEYLRVNIN